MKPLLWSLLALLCLLAIELIRRSFGTLDCYVTLRYAENFVLTLPRSKLLTECVQRVLLFPFYLF